MLASTIIGGGFISVPRMIYMAGASTLISSASELVIAVVMCFGGSIKLALSGPINTRLTILKLAGSLVGVQLDTIGTTY